MNITAKQTICMVIGDPVGHSLSPQMHNSAYKALNIDNQYIFIAAKVDIKNVKYICNTMVALSIRGVSCTIPHKIEIMKYLTNIDPIAKKIGAVNTLVNTNGIIKGYNTDWLGVVVPLEKITGIADKKVALLGAGGAARAIAYGIVKRGGRLKIYNRHVEKAVALANEFRGEARSLDQLEEVSEADIIINSTPVGMVPNINETPLPKEFIQKNHIIFDIVYNPLETKLIRDAKEKGAKTICGFEMLLYQGIAQFELYTNKKAPVEVMRKTLLQCLKEKINEK